MFVALIRKSVRLSAAAVFAALVAGSVGTAAVATTVASRSSSVWRTGQVNRDAVPGAGMAHAKPADDLPSFLLRPDGQLRNGLTPNPPTYG